VYNGYFINGECEMSELKITPIAVSIHQSTEHPLFGEGVIHLNLEDEAGGFFFEVSQEGQSFRVDFEELKQLVVAGKFLLDGTWSNV
jgi:hypothetical protein